MSDWSDPALADIAERVRRTAGVAFPPRRRRAAEAEIVAAMRLAGCEDPVAYAARLDSAPASLALLCGALVAVESRFFRDPGQFAAVRRHVFPAFVGLGRRLRVWSAGCAAGEEAYSLAIALQDAGLPATIHATDLSPALIARARDGIYDAQAFHGEAGQAALRHCEPCGDHWQVAQPLREQVRFAPLNLAADIDGFAAANGPFDLVFCRNVLLYLDPPAARRALCGLAASLAEGGWLALGALDPVPENSLLRPDGNAANLFRRGDAPVDMIPAMLHQTDTGSAAGAADAIRHVAASGDFAAAASLAAASVSRFADSAELHFLHGMLLAELGHYGEAAAAMRRTVDLDDTLAVAHIALGTLQQRLGCAAEADDSFDRAEQIVRGRAGARPPS